METKHTPGPWYVRDGQEIMCGNPFSENRLIAQCHAGHKEERSANAVLIASAPDLLTQRDELVAVCEAVAALADGQGRANLMHVAGQARAALAKVRQD